MDFAKDLIVNIGNWLGDVLASTGLPDPWLRIVSLAGAGLVLALLPIIIVIFLIWAERKVVARMQDRLGPNASGVYAGPYAIFQTIADAIKMLTKEDVVPAAADRWVFNAAPVVILSVAIAIWAVIPLGSGLIGADLNIGILYVLSLGAGGLVSLMMAGWGSNNKYSLIGALRAIAQLISYEIPQVLAILAVVMVAGSFSMQDIIEAQDVAFVFAMPVTAMLFLVASLAEVGRVPFDLAEADSEIVAGYFVEYSGMKFGQFYLSEFINNTALCAIVATLFLGGWRGPFVDTIPVLGSLWLLLKTLAVFFLFMWLRGTMVRLRIDQMLRFNWKFLVPLALVNICVIALVDSAVPASGVAGWVRPVSLLTANVALLIGTAIVLTVSGRRARSASGQSIAAGR